MYSGINSVLHFVVPIIGFVSVVFLEKGADLKVAESLYGAVPMVIYGIVYYILTIPVYHMSGEWNDFYHLNEGGLAWVNFSIILICTMLFCVAMWWIRKIYIRKIK